MGHGNRVNRYILLVVLLMFAQQSLWRRYCRGRFASELAPSLPRRTASAYDDFGNHGKKELVVR